jgi:hypothetical protein
LRLGLGELAGAGHILARGYILNQLLHLDPGLARGILAGQEAFDLGARAGRENALRMHEVVLQVVAPLLRLGELLRDLARVVEPAVLGVFDDSADRADVAVRHGAHLVFLRGAIEDRLPAGRLLRAVLVAQAIGLADDAEQTADTQQQRQLLHQQANNTAGGGRRRRGLRGRYGVR